MSRFLLDTNILSEGSQPQPDRKVEQRLAMHQAASVMAAPTWYELVRGIAILPPGARRNHYDRYLQRVRSSLEMIAYDAVAAEIHARAEAKLKQRGRHLQIIDGQIASIAVAHDLVLVTRNVRDFEFFPELKTINWFDQA